METRSDTCSTRMVFTAFGIHRTLTALSRYEGLAPLASIDFAFLSETESVSEQVCAFAHLMQPIRAVISCFTVMAFAHE